MSVYGYSRRTTPNLERLAAGGVVFEHAYSNSSWSKPSTTSFMTSLHNSVLGNTKLQFDPLPSEAVTMAEHFHRAGYRTAVLTSNAWAGSMSNLDRGVDVLREHGVDNDAISSAVLHQDYWDWRQSYPGSPYWVHFQTTDPHAEGEGQEPPAPFLHLFPSPGEWENTPLIVAADHSTWPGGIAGGRRIGVPVSMIDVLPNVLDLVALPQPEVLQGQSLVPLTPEQLETLRSLGYIQWIADSVAAGPCPPFWVGRSYSTGWVIPVIVSQITPKGKAGES